MLNKIVKPMLLSESDTVLENDNYIYEIKFDGIRALIYVIDNNIKIFTRNGKNITNLFPELKVITSSVKKNSILDGEIVCLTNNKPDFFKVQKRIHLKNKDKIEISSKNNPALFICFDILYYEKDITNEPLYKRKDELSKINESDYLLKSKVFEDGEKLFKSIKRLDLEGIVCKDKFSTYQVNTRSNSWIKVKNYKVESFFVGGNTDGEKDRFSIYLGEKSNGKLRYVGKVFVSKKDKLYEKLKNRKSVNNPFLEFKENINFVNPIQEVKIKYIERNNNNHLREAFYMH